MLIAISSNSGFGRLAQLRRLDSAFAAHIGAKDLGQKLRSLVPLDTSALVFIGGFCACALTNLSRKEFAIFIKWTSPFPF